VKRLTLAGWHHDLTAPERTYTLLELLLLWIVVRLQKRTMREWASRCAPLRAGDDTPPLTMDEALLFAAISGQDRQAETQAATEHLEGMFGRFETFMAFDAASGRYPIDEAHKKALTNGKGQ
jgi:hypothetical protein